MSCIISNEIDQHLADLDRLNRRSEMAIEIIDGLEPSGISRLDVIIEIVDGGGDFHGAFDSAMKDSRVFRMAASQAAFRLAKKEICK